MLTKESHPFICNTLESDPRWALIVNYWHGWEVSLVWGDPDDSGDAFAMAHTLSDALDKLEALLSGKDNAL